MKKNLFILTALLLAALASNAQGVSKLFGLVGGGVQSNQSSNGFLFSTAKDGTNLQVQYSFPVNVDGASPANLEMIPYNNKMYGTTYKGGASDYGTIFEYDPATNIYTKKFDFGPTVSVTGGGPKGSLLLYNNKFYGLAAEYGASGGGCLFEWDPATNIYTKKFDFTGNGGAYPGSGPQNSLRLMNGKMYGTTLGGGGTNVGVVFEWDPVTNVYTKLFELNGTNGWSFYNNVTPYNNKIYCMSVQGAANGYGALYVIDPALAPGSNTTTIKVFDLASGGAANNNEMVVYNNKLYGCLHQGGTNSGGTIFELDPATNTFNKLADFNGTGTGSNPQGKLVLNGNKFLGLCSNGGANNYGSVFEWDPATPATITRKASFQANNFDVPANPGSTLSLFNSKYYAVCYNGGFVNQGTMFEYDNSTATITKKLNFNAAENGRIPYGKPVLLNGKLYGVCYQGPKEIFGTPYGCLWSFDPSTSTYSRKFLFDNLNGAANGRAPISAPVAYNGKLLGTTYNGGISDIGILYEYDPVTEIYVKKDMQLIGGSFPISEPTLYNNKFYGMTNAGGLGNNGIIYSYDPANGTLAKVYDVQSSGGNTPGGGFTAYNNKLYGTTSSGGANNNGTVIMFDPATNTATTVFNLAGATGASVNNAMTLYNNKLYGTAFSGGSAGRGVIFRFDPSDNSWTVLHHFTTSAGGTGLDPKGELTVSGDKLYCITQENNNLVKIIELDPVSNTVATRFTHTTSNSNLPVLHNGLTVVPAFIANGTLGSCETYPTVIIDATNTNQWVPILNTSGDIVAEIKANGNLLGTVTASTYIHNGTVREDAIKQLYMDRNISISTQNPVTGSNVDIRLYIKTSEYLALKNASNSIGQPSGIGTVNDIAILKNGQSCSSSLSSAPTRLTTTATPYEYGYVLQSSINSFSTFFFAKNNFAVLPVQLRSFAASKCSEKICLAWTVDHEENFSHYEVEKIRNGNVIRSIGRVEARRSATLVNYTLIDNNPESGDNLYRLKMIDADGKFSYSAIINVNLQVPAIIQLQPNPASEFITVKGVGEYSYLTITDMSGSVKLQQKITQSIEWVNLQYLPAGMYILRAYKGTSAIALPFMKQ